MGKLEIDSIIKYYDDKIILSDISIEVKQSEVLGIFGRNGSGKTTLLNIILGLEKCNFIYRRYNNIIIKRKDIRSLFSYSSQKIFIPEHIKIRDLIKLFGINNQQLIHNDHLILDSMNIRFKELSYGQKFYVQLFLVINSRKKICVLDEPFAGLSPLYIKNIVKYIKNNSDKIFIITDHNTEKLFEISNNKMFLKHGKLIYINDKSFAETKEMYYS